MTPETSPPSLPKREPGPVAQAWQILLKFPQPALLPMFLIQVPVAVVAAAVTTVLFLTTFSDQRFVLVTDIDGDTPGRLAFMLVAVGAVQALFSQVARAATIVAVANAKQSKPVNLSATLDPAFTKMGGILLLSLVLVVLGAALAASLVGLLLIPYIFLALEAYMLESRPAISAIGRSVRVMIGNGIRLVLTMLFALGLCIGPILLVSVLNLFVEGDRTEKVILSGVFTVVNTVLLVPVIAFLTAITTIFFLKAQEKHDHRSTARI